MATTMTADKAIEGDKIAELGRSIYERIKPELEKISKGSHIVINVCTGEYVTGDTMDAACDAFDRRYGNVPAYVRRIGQPIRV